MASGQTHTHWPRALAKWAEIRAKRPELAPAVELQTSLLALLLHALDGLKTTNDSGPVSLALRKCAQDAAARAAGKWGRGLPAFRNEPMFIPETLDTLVPEICGILAAAGAGEHALQLRATLVSGRIDPHSVLQVALARNQKAMRTSALHLDFSPDLLWLVGELASSPVAFVLQERLNLEVGTEISQWNRGYCPCCGSWPVVMERLDGRRDLRCSFCACAWTLAEARCPYCGKGGDTLLEAAPVISDPSRQLEMCTACGGYTKVIRPTAATPFPFLAIEDLATMDLDEAAMQRGYGRPDLVDLDAIEPLTSPGCA